MLKRIIVATFELIEFSQQVNPTKILWAQTGRVKVTIASRCVEGVRLEDFSERAISLAELCVSYSGISDRPRQSVLRRNYLVANFRFEVSNIGQANRQKI